MTTLQSKADPLSEAKRTERGFSVVELLIVVGLMIILTAISVFAIRPTRKNISADDAAELVTNYLREAYHRALTQRQTFRVDIDVAGQWVILTDENRLPVGDEIEVKRSKLVSPVSMTRPVSGGSPLPLPPSPYNYPSATFTSSLVWSARFKSDGTVVDTDGNPMSATLFFSPAQLGSNDFNLVRAITLFGPSGSTRTWRFDGTNFDGGGK